MSKFKIFLFGAALVVAVFFIYLMAVIFAIDALVITVLCAFFIMVIIGFCTSVFNSGLTEKSVLDDRG